MGKPYVMQLATVDDLDSVMQLLNRRIQWLRELGSDQWNTGSTFRTRLTNNIACRETWILRDEGDPIGTITVSTVGDPDFWGPGELTDKAAYISKMASKIERRGQGIGALLVRWTQDWAARSGLNTVRWDAWRTNPRLQDYYRSLGATHVRTVDVADRWSGALFEVPAKVLPELSSEVTSSS